jgi:hypothetical protein
MDNGWLILLASQGRFFPDNVYATMHPLYQSVSVLLFNLFGVYAVAYLNSFLMLPIAYVIYRLGQTLGLDRHYADFSALGVVLLQNVFWVSTKVEVYALHLLIMLTTYWIIFDEEISVRQPVKSLIVGVLTGVGVATHQLTFIVLFPLYIYMWQRDSWRVLFTVPGFLLGLFPLYPAIFNQIALGRNPLSLIRAFMTGVDGISPIGWEGALFRFDKILEDKNYVMLALLSLCGIGILGLLHHPTAPKHRTLWWAATLNLLFVVSYALNDRFTFFLPGAAFYTMLGVAFVFRRFAEHRLARYVTLALILAHPLIMVGTVVLADTAIPRRSVTLPYRDDIKYFMSPYIPDRSADALVRSYERYVPEGSVVLSDFTPLGALHSAQVSGLFTRRELKACDEENPRWPNKMYLVRNDYCKQYLQEYKLERAPLGWIVLKK